MVIVMFITKRYHLQRLTLTHGSFREKKWKKTLFSLCFSSVSLSLPLFLYTHSLGSFEFNQFHQSKLWRTTQKRCSIHTRQTSSAHMQTLSTWHQRPCTWTREAHWIGVVRCFCRWHLPETFLSRLIETAWAFRGWKHHECRLSPRHQNDTVHPMSSHDYVSMCTEKDYGLLCIVTDDIGCTVSF